MKIILAILVAPIFLLLSCVEAGAAITTEKSEINLRITLQKSQSPRLARLEKLHRETDGSITGIISMVTEHGDDCTLKNTPVRGIDENGELLLQVRVPDENKHACLLEISLRLQAQGKFKGGYLNVSNNSTGTVEEK